MTDTDKLKRLAEAATQGPWGWHGNQHDLYLATKDRGRIYVMGFDRMGFRSAQPTFRVGSRIKKASEIVSFEVGDNAVRGFSDAKDNDSVYRYDVTGIDAPDAKYIAAASPDVILALIAENERLRVERKEILSLVSETSMKCGEAVALLRHCYEEPMEPWHEVSAFLDRIDAAD